MITYPQSQKAKIKKEDKEEAVIASTNSQDEAMMVLKNYSDKIAASVASISATALLVSNFLMSNKTP